MSKTRKNEKSIKIVNENIGRYMSVLFSELKPGWTRQQLARWLSVQIVKNLPNEQRNGFKIGDAPDEISETLLEKFHTYCDEIKDFQVGKANKGIISKRGKNGEVIDYKDFYYTIPNNNNTPVRLSCHISDDQIHNYFTGITEIDPPTLYALCQFFGISIDSFMLSQYENMDELLLLMQDKIDIRKKASIQAKIINLTTMSNNQNITMLEESFKKNPQFKDMICNAENSIFTNETETDYITELRNLINENKIKPGVLITLAIPDYEDEHVLQTQKYFFGGRSDVWQHRNRKFNNAVDEVVNLFAHAEKIPFNNFLPITYFAVDYERETSNSFINVSFYLMTEDNLPKQYSFILRPTDGAKYTDFCNHIKLIKKHATDYVKPFHRKHIDKVYSRQKHHNADKSVQVTKPYMASSHDIFTFDNRNYEKEARLMTHAKHRIFISQVTLQGLHHSYIRPLSNLSSGIEINFAIPDYHDTSVIASMGNFFNLYSNIDWTKIASDFEEDIEKIKEARMRKGHSNDNIKITHMNFFNPIGYIAVDYDEKLPSSVIRPLHYFIPSPSSVSKEYLGYFLTPSSSLYKHYLHQIHLILGDETML